MHKWHIEEGLFFLEEKNKENILKYNVALKSIPLFFNILNLLEASEQINKETHTHNWTLSYAEVSSYENNRRKTTFLQSLKTDEICVY